MRKRVSESVCQRCGTRRYLKHYPGIGMRNSYALYVNDMSEEPCEHCKILWTI